MTVFRQVLIGASPEDAITGMALRVRDRLVGRGESELYGHHVHPDMLGQVRRLEHLPRPRPGDVLIYHASYGEPEVTRVLLERPEPIVLVYHNLTPSRFFLPYNPAAAAALEWGRHELGLIRPQVARAVAMSGFSAQDLRQYGYDRIEVMPVGLDPMRLHAVAPDSRMSEEVSVRFPSGYVLWVSQVLPHKRLELLIGAMHLLRWIHHHHLGVVIVGANRLGEYWKASHQYSRRLNVPDILFTGVVPDPVLNTLYRRAELFVSTSAHEGLAVPPLEAMAFGVPVIAPDAGALGETVSDAGLVLPADAGPVLFSEAMAELVTNPGLRSNLVTRGFRRSEEFRRSGDVQRFVELLEEVA